MIEYSLADSLVYQVQMYIEVRLQLQLLYHIEQLAQIANVMIAKILKSALVSGFILKSQNEYL